MIVYQILDLPPEGNPVSELLVRIAQKAEPSTETVDVYRNKHNTKCFDIK